jgi:hypothetical protein
MRYFVAISFPLSRGYATCRIIFGAPAHDPRAPSGFSRAALGSVNASAHVPEMWGSNGQNS